MPMVGQQVPDFELRNQDGGLVRLRDLRQQKVIIFAFSPDDPDSSVLAAGFNDAQAQIAESNGLVLGISTETPAALWAWHAQHGLSFDLLSDPDHEVLETWGAWGSIQDSSERKNGVLRAYWVIDEAGLVIDALVRGGAEQSVRLALKTLAAYTRMRSA